MAEKSSIDGAAAVAAAGAERTREHSGEATAGIAVAEEPHSTSEGSAGVGGFARHTSVVGHVPRVKQLKLESLTEECGRWADMDATCVSRP